MKSKFKPLPDIEVLREHFDYDPLSGILKCKKSWTPQVLDGQVMKSMDRRGYGFVSFNYKCYPIHRVIFKLMTGKEPEGPVDHKDRNPQNNRWENLRGATFSQNVQNQKRPRNNTSGVKGVSWYKAGGKWEAYVGKNGKRVWRERFTDFNAAALAVRAMREIFHGEFARHG